MKYTLVIGAVAVILCLYHSRGYALPANGTGANKFDFGTGPSTPAIGSTFDEIVVESNLKVFGKNPTGRSQRTKLLPVPKSNETKTETKSTTSEP